MALKASQPLLALLPSALGTYFAEHVGGLEGRALDRVKPVRYLRDNYEARVHVVKSCYIVPHVGGHAKVHAARACPSYHGRPVFSDLAVQGLEVDAATGLDVNTIWYGRAILFFRAFEKVQEWDEDKQRQVPKSKPHELVFLRWYRVTGYTDVAHCRILEWECSRGQQPSVQVRSIESLIGVEMMLPKTSATHGKELWYQNKYLKL